MTVAITQCSRPETEAYLRRALRCTVGGIGLAVAVASEHMRAALYGAALCHAGRSHAPTTHTTRLLNNPRRVLELMADQKKDQRGDPTQDDATFALRALHQIGDAVDTGHGQWLGAPTKLLAVEGLSDLLLTGSIPHASAESFLKRRVFCAGAARFVESPAGGRPEVEDLVVPMRAWFGQQPSLATWTEAILTAHAARMNDEGGVPADQLELYAPDVLRSQGRPGRWVVTDQIGSGIDGMRLCRPRQHGAPRHDRPHYLGTFEFRRGNVILRRYVPIEHRLTLRLRFGLDQRFGTPRAFAIVSDHETFAVERPPALPEPEARVYSLGWEEPDPAPARKAFHIRALPFLLHVLKNLSITPTITQRATA